MVKFVIIVLLLMASVGAKENPWLDVYSQIDKVTSNFPNGELNKNDKQVRYKVQASLNSLSMKFYALSTMYKIQPNGHVEISNWQKWSCIYLNNEINRIQYWNKYESQSGTFKHSVEEVIYGLAKIKGSNCNAYKEFFKL